MLGGSVERQHLSPTAEGGCSVPKSKGRQPKKKVHDCSPRVAAPRRPQPSPSSPSVRTGGAACLHSKPLRSCGDGYLTAPGTGGAEIG